MRDRSVSVRCSQNHAAGSGRAGDACCEEVAPDPEYAAREITKANGVSRRIGRKSVVGRCARTKETGGAYAGLVTIGAHGARQRPRRRFANQEILACVGHGRGDGGEETCLIGEDRDGRVSVAGEAERERSPARTLY